MEVVLAIFPPLELVEDAVGEGTETLRADEAGGVEELPVRVHDLRFRLEAIVTASAGDALQVHDARHGLEMVVVPSEGGWRVVKKQFSGSVLGGHCCCCPDVQLSPLSVWARHAYLAQHDHTPPPQASPPPSRAAQEPVLQRLGRLGRRQVWAWWTPQTHQHTSEAFVFFRGILYSCVSSH